MFKNEEIAYYAHCSQRPGNKALPYFPHLKETCWFKVFHNTAIKTVPASDGWGIRRTVQPSNQANWNPQRQTSP